MASHTLTGATVHPAARAAGLEKDFSPPSATRSAMRSIRMSRRSLFAALAALALTAWVGNVAVAADHEHEGTVVSASEGKLTMADKDGKEHSHTVGTDTKVTIDGRDGKLTDLKKGDKIKVTMGEDKKKVTKIEAKRG
jgi:hypothetical protein